MRKHNLTGRLTALFIDSKLTLVLILAALIFGLYAVLTTPREENPQISMPAAVVQTLLPGASPEEVEEKLVRPLEALINQIPGVDHVTAIAADSAAVLTVQFEVGEEKEPSLVKLAERLLGGRSALPAEARGPFIRSADADDVPILALSLISDEYDDAALKALGLRMLDELQSLEGISSTSVVGGRSNEYRIRIDPKRLQNYGLSFDDVKNAVLASNVAGPIGRYVEPAAAHSKRACALRISSHRRATSKRLLFQRRRAGPCTSRTLRTSRPARIRTPTTSAASASDRRPSSMRRTPRSMSPLRLPSRKRKAPMLFRLPIK